MEAGRSACRCHMALVSEQEAKRGGQRKKGRPEPPIAWIGENKHKDR
jgi:hypothetical protein